MFPSKICYETSLTRYIAMFSQVSCLHIRRIFYPVKKFFFSLNKPVLYSTSRLSQKTCFWYHKSILKYRGAQLWPSNHEQLIDRSLKNHLDQHDFLPINASQINFSEGFLSRYYVFFMVQWLLQSFHCVMPLLDRYFLLTLFIDVCSVCDITPILSINFVSIVTR